MMTDKEAQEIWNKVVQRAWKDEKFKQKLLSNPKEVLAEYNLSVPKNVQIKVAEDTTNSKHLTLPRNPEELQSEELLRMTGGAGAMDCPGHMSW
jgi:hypothetical protein